MNNEECKMKEETQYAEFLKLDFLVIPKELHPQFFIVN